MLYPIYRKARKLGRGLIMSRAPTPVLESGFWDGLLFQDGVDDKKTIAAWKGELATALHYSSVETIILKYLAGRGRDISTARVLDIGSGAGHWIDFYLRIGAAAVTGIEIARNACAHLQAKYANSPVTIRQGDAVEALQSEPETFDIVNAVGVMFHLTNDAQWEAAVRAIGPRTRKGGVLIVGGHFGLIDGLNVQGTRSQTVKRLRSKAHWKRVLRSAGFQHFRVTRNRAWLSTPEELPEANVLFASRTLP